MNHITRQHRELMTYSATVRHRSHQLRSAPSKRTTKAQGQGKGLSRPKNFRVVPQVDMNRIYLRPEQRL